MDTISDNADGERAASQPGPYQLRAAEAVAVLGTTAGAAHSVTATALHAIGLELEIARLKYLRARVLNPKLPVVADFDARGRIPPRYWRMAAKGVREALALPVASVKGSN